MPGCAGTSAAATEPIKAGDGWLKENLGAYAKWATCCEPISDMYGLESLACSCDASPIANI